MARPGKYFRRFLRDPEFRLRAWKWYVHHKSIYAKGESEVGFIRNAFFGFQSFMVGWLFIRSIFPEMSALLLAVAAPVLIVTKILVYYRIGRYWDREKLFRVEKTWSNERDPMAEAVSRKLLNGTGLEVK